MSFPTIPNVTPSINLSCDQVVNLLLASIAFEELGLAHLINSEAEKIQFVLGTLPGQTTSVPPTFGNLISINRSVESMLRTIVKQQMLLQFKLEDVLDITCSTTTSSSTTTTTTTTTTTATETTTTTTETTTTTTETTTTTTESSTTTTATETTTTTTPPILIVQNIATASGDFDGTTYSAESTAFYNTSTPPVISGNNTTETQLPGPPPTTVIGGVNLGNLPNYLFFFANGSEDANWQGASKGFVGDVAVNGLVASERTSGTVPYAGTIYTNAPTLGAWQDIVDQNPGQAFAATNEIARISGLQTDLINAFNQINALPATPGFTSVDSSALDGLNTENGMQDIIVINVTSGFQISSQINITGDPEDVFILRWDEDANPTNGYQGEVKFQSGGAIVPLGGLTPSNFIHVAGDINSSGGGTTPNPPYPQGPRFDDGQGALINGGSDFSGGGFFTGYWLTTGAPDIFDPSSGLYVGTTQPLSNGIFVGGWYTLTTKFSMTSGTSGVYVSPNPPTLGTPGITALKEVSVDNGLTFQPAPVPPGPPLPPGVQPWFRITVTNTGEVTLTDVAVIDSVLGPIGTVPTLTPGSSVIFTIQTV